MTLSLEHEYIVEDVNSLVSSFLVLNYPSHTDWEKFNIWQSIESVLPSTLIGHTGRYHADFYLNFDDGGGTIFFEIGHMPDGKWNNVLAQDAKPVRVIRIGFDRNISILHPRRTDFESNLMQYLENHLKEH